MPQHVLKEASRGARGPVTPIHFSWRRKTVEEKIMGKGFSPESDKQGIPSISISAPDRADGIALLLPSFWSFCLFVDKLGVRSRSCFCLQFLNGIECLFIKFAGFLSIFFLSVYKH